MLTLSTIWLLLIGFAIMMYVLLDGFDLGVGILFLFIRNEHQREIMLSTILPVWDGNETWLVFGGATLYGAFPLAFSLLLPELYLPLMIMVVALLFRGIVFEFYHKANRSKFVWNISFIFGSLVTTVCQGLVLGTFIKGFTGNHTDWQWASLFSGFTALSLIFGYLLLGATWLVMRTEGELHERARTIAKIALVLTAICMLVVSVWTPTMNPLIAHRWFGSKIFLLLLPIPMIAVLVVIWNWLALWRNTVATPFFLSIALFLLAFVGFVVSVWPYIVPFHMAYWEAAASYSSLLFMLIGAVIMLPLLLGYTAYAYHIFRGKVRDVVRY